MWRHDPAAARQDAAVHVANESNPAGRGCFWGYKNCGAIGDEAGAPPNKRKGWINLSAAEPIGRNVLFLTCVDDGESLVRDCGLNPQQFHAGVGRTIFLDWSVAPKTARADLQRASRSFRVRRQDAFDIMRLCGTLQQNEKLTIFTTSHVKRALAPWNATAHSIKRGALRHAAEIVETYNLDPHVIPQVARHVDPFDLSQSTVRYLGRCTTMLTQVSSLATLMRREKPRKGRNPG
ncbi:hypothetical protein MOQ_002579 [Trypanosoma cruzi marinkellei]|uniref:Trans-sialidase n=1 Tax=Trypanosoma cruzi marinkellei TaxID=85056 RepID=K2MEA4_TRYCR|nr:hypothetical protein MOQ_002579 [Trypanosoma cruzi marinkellei]